ncbi:MFS general substrate transporter [Laetiporus sulphureus 93-53]|uniref:MFS general substrate transporter n=1 Tax=Laetiporus sulphureus 93-53 TaxID=1314785 RepID=A0A165C827_9APHY|nr:MFS general substrate transporter [Laetiporus sulphureus 93-53]KZT02366.1 MFS general substrate transporter [Laetiporus sulphureus 93-53]
MTHDRTRADLSFPFTTTDVERGGFTDEYRTTSKTGYMQADLALRPIPTHVSELPGALRDPEKAAQLKDMKLVTWLPNDPEDPRNWSDLYRWYLTGVCALTVVCAAFGSAVVTGDFKDIEDEFHVGEVVIALTVSLMVVGFGIGPLIWAPLSELMGRRPIWIGPAFLYVIFNIPCAVAKNIQTLCICRFFCGIFASSPLALAGGTISDLWDNNERGFAIALFAAAPYGGPVLGPIVGGFIGENIGWRWIIWINMIFSGLSFGLTCTLPETFAPTLLKKRAARLRKETGNPNITTEQELFQASLTQIIIETLIRPFQMLATEPILLLMSLYVALIYGLLYAFFFAFPVVFTEAYHFDDGHSGLVFSSVLIGLFIALFVTPRIEADYRKRAEAKGGRADPEDRLVGMMIGCWFIPVSLFIFGWTSPPAVMPGGGNWVGPCSSGIPFGFGMVILYFSANAYLIDAFPGYVASALAAKTVVRSGSGAAMPLFIEAMYHNLGNGWAASTWAFISIAMIPVPFLFYRYGKAIRAKSKRAAA